MPRRLIGQTTSTGHLKRRRPKSLGTALFGSISPDQITPEREELIARWSADPWEFFTGKDIDGTAIIQTRDESDPNTPYKPFPQEYAFLRVITRELFGPIQPVIFDKPRQTMVTIMCCLGLYWDCLFHSARKCFISKHQEKEACDLLREKIRSVHRRTPRWFQKQYPLTDEPADRIYFTNTESDITAVSQTAAVGAFRGPTPSIILIDEAAFQDNFGDMFQAAAASALTNGCKLWIPTTPNIGNPGAAVARAMIEGKDIREVVREQSADEDFEEAPVVHGPGWDQR